MQIYVRIYLMSQIYLTLFYYTCVHVLLISLSCAPFIKSMIQLLNSVFIILDGGSNFQIHKYFLTHQFCYMIRVLKRTISSRRFLELPQHMFKLRNKKNIFFSIMHTYLGLHTFNQTQCLPVFAVECSVTEFPSISPALKLYPQAFYIFSSFPDICLPS